MVTMAALPAEVEERLGIHGALGKQRVYEDPTLIRANLYPDYNGTARGRIGYSRSENVLVAQSRQ